MALRVLQVAAVGALVATLWSDWFVVRTGTDTARFSAMDVAPVGALATVAIGVLVGALLASARLGRDSRAVAVLLPAGCLAVTGVGSVLLARILVAVGTPAFVPASLRRYVADVRPGVGMALAMVALVVVATAALEDPRRSITVRGRTVRSRFGDSLAPLVAAAAAAAAIGVARYSPWLSASAGQQTWHVPGWGVPYVGIAQGVMLVLGLAGVGLFLVRGPLPAGLTLAFCGWAVSFSAAVVIVPTRLVDGIDLPQLLPDAIAASAPTLAVSPRPALWVTYAAGLLMAAAGVFLVRRAIEVGR